MSISWDNWSVRVYAAEAWVSLAPRFAAEHDIIISRIDAILSDPKPAVRLQAARNLQVISLVAPERMWAMGERIAAIEANDEVLVSYLNHSLWHFSNSEPERCERILATVRGRLGEFAGRKGARDRIQESLGGWIARLFVDQGRPLLGEWLKEWAADPEQSSDLLNSYSSSLRGAFFDRYAATAGNEGREMCDRAQKGLEAILTHATKLSSGAHAGFSSKASEEEKQVAGRV